MTADECWEVKNMLSQIQKAQNRLRCQSPNMGTETMTRKSMFSEHLPNIYIHNEDVFSKRLKS